MLMVYYSLDRYQWKKDSGAVLKSSGDINACLVARDEKMQPSLPSSDEDLLLMMLQKAPKVLMLPAAGKSQKLLLGKGRGLTNSLDDFQTQLSLSPCD
jgi:hypothetical protein